MMNKNKSIKYKQRKLRKTFAYILIINLVIIFTMMFTSLIMKSNDDNSSKIEVSSTSINNYDTVIYQAESFGYSRDWDGEDDYLLAKIAMTEAESESIETKVLVILTVLNRVHSDDFPDSIEEVIFEENNGVYQFTPVKEGGRWWYVEPNEECYKAVETVKKLKHDFSNGALYFEACTGKSWQSENLEFICQYDNTRFYK